MIFIAPPAAGKGTQSTLLVNKYNYQHISTGNLLREETEKEGKYANQINEIISAGNLVSDEIVYKLLEKCLSNIMEPFIIDGYPRNIDQAKDLEKLLSKLGISLNLVVYLNIPEDLALKRALGRLYCPKCDMSYHKYMVETKPKVEGKCDNCLEELLTRSDDNEESFKERYKNYIKNVSPLLEYYQEKGILIQIDKLSNPDETFVEIEKVI